MTDTHDPTPPALGADLVPLKAVTARYHLRRDALLRLVDAGEFPPCLRVTARTLLWRAADLQEWEAGRWMRPGDLSTTLGRLRLVGQSIRQPRIARTGTGGGGSGRSTR